MNHGLENRPIGSFFESTVLTGRSHAEELPWANVCHVSYVQTGRQALAVIAAAYAAEGRDLLLVPDYLCESMLLGFDGAHWKLDTYRITEALTIDTEDLVNKVTDPPRTVVLSATYFGNEPSADHISSMRMIRDAGARVIEDETHRVLGSLEMVGDVAIASLRKILPVADGAYIRGDFVVTPQTERENQGWRAMDKKLSGDFETASRIFSLANTDLESWISPPARASSRTLRTLSTLKYEEFRAIRRDNAQALRAYLAKIPGIEVINQAEIPSHLVIRVADARFVQQKLAEVAIFCPIHWSRPDRLSSVEWRHDLLSLPVDHRYSLRDMERIANNIELMEAKC